MSIRDDAAGDVNPPQRVDLREALWKTAARLAGSGRFSCPPR